MGNCAGSNRVPSATLTAIEMEGYYERLADTLITMSAAYAAHARALALRKGVVLEVSDDHFLEMC